MPGASTTSWPSATGVTRAQAMEEMRSRATLIGAMLLRRGDADAMLCGTTGNYLEHLKYVRRRDRQAAGRRATSPPCRC